MSSKLVLFSRLYDRLVALQPALGPFDLEMTKNASRTSSGPQVEKAVFLYVSSPQCGLATVANSAVQFMASQRYAQISDG